MSMPMMHQVDVMGVEPSVGSPGAVVSFTVGRHPQQRRDHDHHSRPQQIGDQGFIHGILRYDVAASILGDPSRDAHH